MMEESGSVIYETLVSPTDLTPVLEALDQANASLEQLHADASLIFLAGVLLIGVVLGCAIGFMIARMWQV